LTSDSQLGAESRTNLKELWRAALGELQLAMPKANYDTWFKETYVVSEEDDVFCIGVPNAFAREWLENKYRGQVRSSLQRLVGRTVDVRFITVPGGQGAVREVAELILQARGEWQGLLTQYFLERGDVAHGAQRSR